MIILSWWDIVLGSSLLLVLSLLCVYIGLLSMSRSLLLAGIRTVLQLLLIGWVLKFLFTQAERMPWLLLVMASVMLLAAGHEIVSRQQWKFTGSWNFLLGLGSIFLSSFMVGLFALLLVLQPQPWYSPQYAIPLLGILMGNTMSGITLGLDKLTQSVQQQRPQIEARLMLGHSWSEAIADIRRDSVRTGLLPILHTMTAAGIITLPGMMTGQIMAGVSPLEAVKYQILMMLLIPAGTGFGTVLAVFLGARRLFDPRQRLCLNRIKEG